MNPDPRIVEALRSVFHQIVPEVILGLTACVLFLGATFRADRHFWAAVALGGLCLAGVGLYTQPHVSTEAIRSSAYIGSLLVDGVALWTRVIALATGVILVFLSWNEVPHEQSGEYHGCLLLIAAGLCLTGSANDLITLFLALELISIPTYVLLYLPRSDKAAQEAAMKYFLLSIFASGLMLFGFSYLYGLTGTTNMSALTAALAQGKQAGLTGLVAVALVLVMAGLGFRITAVPFHFYAPDVYQGTTPAAAGLLAFVPKVAGFVALLRILGYSTFDLHGRAEIFRSLALDMEIANLLWILAAVTMTIGNILALLQDNLKRMLAYSGVAHAGYMLMGTAVAPYLHGGQATRSLPAGIEAIQFYLIAYGAMTVGAFAVLAYLSTPTRPVENVDDLAGLSRSHPGIALLTALFLFSLIGIPLTAGFWGKLLIFLGALAEEGGWRFRLLAVIGAINAAIAAWYYLRVVTVMYLRTPIKPLERKCAWPGLAALWLCAALTLGIGIYPWPLLSFSTDNFQLPIFAAP